MSNFNTTNNKRLLMRQGDLNLKYKDLPITSTNFSESATTFGINYKANTVYVKSTDVNMKFTDGIIDMDNSDVNIEGENKPVAPTEGYVVRYLDYDGTILKTEYVMTGDTATPPVVPTHEYLTFDSWNISSENIQRNTDIGAIYSTTDGKSYLFIGMSKLSGFQPTLYLSKLEGTTLNIEWGDGETSTVSSGTNVIHQKPTPYNSGTTGLVNAIIKIGATGDYGFGNSNNSVFYNQQYLLFNKIYIGNINSIDNNSLGGCRTLQSVTIPKSITSIDYVGFSLCIMLQSIIIPNSVTSIGNNCFNYCYALQSISIPDSIISIGDFCFGSCYALQSIIIPNSVTGIGNNCFGSCYALQSISIPDDVDSIGEHCFHGCFTLQSINIPSYVSFINKSTFSSCYTLQSINIPEGVTSIGDNSFYINYTLQSIIIPSTVAIIGDYSFGSCFALRSIIFTALTPPFFGTSIFMDDTTVNIYVPDESIDVYKTATNLEQYSSRIYPISHLNN